MHGEESALPHDRVTPRTLRFGAWPSPISAEITTQAGVRFPDTVAVDGGDVFWVEGRPRERGRSVVVRRSAAGAVDDVGPDSFDARTRVHEYGGGAYAVHRGAVFASHFPDQRIYRIDAEGEPIAITPEPPAPAADRYADLVVGGDWGIAVRETHRDGEVVNELVRIDLSGSAAPVAIASGHDFYAAPRLSPDGTRLAWITWDHPDMPWDRTALWVAPVDPSGRGGAAQRIAAGDDSILQPEWSPDGVLHFASDRSGWWNLYRVIGPTIEPVHPMTVECAVPHWVFGSRRYAFLEDGRIAVLAVTPFGDGLRVIAGGEVAEIPTPFLAFGHCIAAAGNRVVVVGTAPDRPTTIATIDVDSAEVTPLRSADGPALPAGFHAIPERLEFATPDGPAFAWFYPPTNPECRGPDGAAPPVLVTIHGGPSSHSVPRLDPEIIFWTSRGIGVLDVDHGGSTMAGRGFRQRLDGNWGVVDVRDCALAARHAAATGRADPGALLIRGGSAGGFTTLLALALYDDFAAGAAYYGVADLETLAADTHKFESRYLDRLIGPYPERRDLYVERSPITHVGKIRVPVLLLQGLEDRVVPPEQSRAMRDALVANGVPVTLLEFPGEGHGFRAAATRIAALEAELAFYGGVLGFTPAGV